MSDFWKNYDSKSTFDGYISKENKLRSHARSLRVYLKNKVKKNYDLEGEKRKKNYYVNESVGIASGFLLTALHQSGLVTLTHTPSPMGFLEKILNRPKNERAVLLIPVGFPYEDAVVPKLEKKSFEQICSIV